MPSLDEKRQQLLKIVKSYGSCAVAFSGGVDSTVLAKAAALALGDRAVAVTGVSQSLAEGELQAARSLAEEIGIRHLTLATDEFANVQYTRNAPDRCYHCKTELYLQMASRKNELGVEIICNGANVDDQGDYRPGMKAAKQQNVCSPLVESELSKAEVRELARRWNLPVWDKPATPCLSSRVAYGEEVTAERLGMIDRAERFLRARGLLEVRVRYHRGDIARIEVPTDAISGLVEATRRGELVEAFKRYGFRFITIDLEGFRGGSLNQLISVEPLSQD